MSHRRVDEEVVGTLLINKIVTQRRVVELDRSVVVGRNADDALYGHQRMQYLGNVEFKKTCECADRWLLVHKHERGKHFAKTRDFGDGSEDLANFV